MVWGSVKRCKGLRFKGLQSANSLSQTPNFAAFFRTYLTRVESETYTHAPLGERDSVEKLYQVPPCQLGERKRGEFTLSGLEFE